MKPEPQTPQSTPLPGPVTSKAEFGSGIVAGEIFFEGTPPPLKRSAVKSFSECAIHHEGTVHTDDILIQDGKLQNVFVYVAEGLGSPQYPAPKEEVLLDQKGCIYAPHVLGIQTGQTLLIKNSDVSLHNVHSHSQKQKDFNLGMPVQGMKIKKSFSESEVMVSVTCDVHPWMNAYIGVLEHPFFSVSDVSGSFRIDRLPSGTYTIEAWHEVFGTQRQTVDLTSDASPTLAFTFSQ